jgi:RecA-family ATPase
MAERAWQQQWGPHAATRDDELTGLEYDRLLREPPARDWMVEGCFVKGTVALVAGDGGIGKSLIMQQLATCAVLGRPWLGLTVQPGRALYLGCEDDGDEIHRRQWAINRSLGRDMADVLDAGLDLIPRVGMDNVLMRLERRDWKMTRTSLMDKLTVRCRRTGIQYVVIDTATQTFAGNQNDENQVVAYVNEFRRLAVAIQGVVIFTKHPSMSGRALGTGESGNVAWNNSVRARLYLHEHKALGLVLDGMKANYGPKLKPVPLKWDHGVFERVEPDLRNYSEAGNYQA